VLFAVVRPAEMLLAVAAFADSSSAYWAGRVADEDGDQWRVHVVPMTTEKTVAQN